MTQEPIREAAYANVLDNGRVRCMLCPHHCTISPGASGICSTRRNQDGRLVSANYCRPISTAVDPIEKKPLYHFFPGSVVFSTGPNGCTFTCDFCQNWEIAQTTMPTPYVPPRELVRRIVESGTIGIAYTYSEPYIWYETIMDVGAAVREHGLVNVMVTNGFMEPEPLRDLLTVVDAMNIDIKSMNPSFYRRLCKGRLEPVLRTCEQVRRAGCHLEVTTLLIPGENDSESEIHSLVDFIAGTLGSNTPLHLSRYFPRHRTRIEPTPLASLQRAYQIARERLEYVYLGNVASDESADTTCPACGTLLIHRTGYRTVVTPELQTDKERGVGTCGTCGKVTGIRLVRASGA